MNAMKAFGCAMVAALGLCLAGCSTSGSVDAVTPVENVQVTLMNGKTFAQVATAAATHRRWTPTVMEDGVIRCTIVQRENRVVVDVVQTSATTFSIRRVESNIPARKYDQWVNNLVREIAYQAAK